MAWPQQGDDAGEARSERKPRVRRGRAGRRRLIAGCVGAAGSMLLFGATWASLGGSIGPAAQSVVAVESGPSHTPAPPAPAATATPGAADESSASPAGTAIATLQGLAVKGRAPKTGYDRDAWAVWSDYDGNGCNERQDTLARDLTDVQRVGCEVVGGRLVDPYTASAIVVPTADPQIDIDHVVSLSDAWQKGASGWSGTQMQRFASDPLNLLAVASSANRSKSDGDAATWLPANKAYRCDMVARQIAVKAEYGLWVTQAERDAMARVLDSCPQQPLPVRGVAPAPVQPGSAAPVPPSGRGQVVPGLDPRFPSCKALKSAGYSGGYVRGVNPEYDWYRDADGDGIVCE